MNKIQALAAFEDFNIRRISDEKAEIWYFSVVDIIAALIQQPDYRAARNYWKVLKNRLKGRGVEATQMQPTEAARRGREVLSHRRGRSGNPSASDSVGSQPKGRVISKKPRKKANTRGKGPTADGVENL